MEGPTISPAGQRPEGRLRVYGSTAVLRGRRRRRQAAGGPPCGDRAPVQMCHEILSIVWCAGSGCTVASSRRCMHRGSASAITRSGCAGQHEYTFFPM